MNLISLIKRIFYTFYNNFQWKVFIVITCLILTGCTTPQERYSQDYKVAEKKFAEHDDRAAFKRIQVPARAGNPNAQYALGYMYYYGDGTLQDPSKAAYWFKQAAQQGQPQAQKALRAMRMNHGNN